MNSRRQVLIVVFIVLVLPILSLCLFAGGRPVSAAPPAQQTETPTLEPTPLAAENLSKNPGVSDNALLIFDAQGILHLFWTDSSERSQGEDVLHRQRSPQGAWSATENLSPDFEILYGDLQALLDPSGRVCLYFNAASNASDPGTIGEYRRCQTAAGWSPAELVTRTPGTRRQNFPVVAPDGSVKALYIVGAGDLYFEVIKLSDDVAAYRPSLIQDHAGGLHAVWTRQGDPFTLEYRYSNDGGATWRQAAQLSDADTAPGGTQALAADAQGRVHLAWVSLNGNIYYRRWSPDSGWSPTVQLDNGGQNNSATTLGLAVNANGQAALAWQGSDTIYYVEQRADGTWTSPRVIAQGAGGGTGPALVVDPNGVRHVVWRGNGQAADLFYAALQSIVTVAAATPSGFLVYESPFFRDHIHDPSILISASPATLATNFLLALILALAMGFFGNLLNATLEANEEEVARILGPFSRAIYRTRAGAGRVESSLKRRKLGWVWTMLQGIGLLVLFGIIYAFVDPDFDPRQPDAILVIFALTISIGLISLIDDLAQYAVLRRYGEHPVVRVHAGNGILAVLSALGSRVFQVTPGILIGSPAGIEEVRETKLDVYLHLAALGAVAVLALAAWFLASVFASNLLVVTVLLLIFAVGVQSLFFEMLPLSNLHGKEIFKFNSLLWGVIVALVAWLFLTTMLNPDGEFLGTFIQPDMTNLAILVGLFCLFSASVWFYFNRLRRREENTDK